MAVDKSGEVWIEPFEAVMRLMEIFGDLAKPAITARLRDGKLKARARKSDSYIDYGFKKLLAPMTGEDLTQTHISAGMRGISPCTGPTTLGPAAWTNGISWDEDVATWDWLDGNFRVTSKLEPLPTRSDYIGVEFLEREVADMRAFRRYVDVLRKSQPMRTSTGRPMKWDWEGMLIALIAKAEFDRLDEVLGSKATGRQAALERWMSGNTRSLDRQGSNPDDKEVRKRAKAVLTALDGYKTLK